MNRAPMTCEIPSNGLIYMSLELSKDREESRWQKTIFEEIMFNIVQHNENYTPTFARNFMEPKHRKQEEYFIKEHHCHIVNDTETKAQRIYLIFFVM